MQYIRLFAMFFHENEYLNYQLTTIVNFDIFTFCGTIHVKWCYKNFKWFYFLS